MTSTGRTPHARHEQRVARELTAMSGARTTGKGAGALWLGENPVHRQRDKCTDGQEAGARRWRGMKLILGIGA